MLNIYFTGAAASIDLGALVKGKMVQVHRKPVIAVIGDESRFSGHWAIREGAVSRVIRKPESLPVDRPGNL